MSQRPIARSPDLSRLRNDGHSVAIVSGWLVISDVPFLDASSTVHTDGKLVMQVTLAGDEAQPPTDHTAYFVGGIPHDRSGQPLHRIVNNTSSKKLTEGLTAACFFSAKPVGRTYTDFHDKVSTYIGHISGPAQATDPRVTACRFRPIGSDDPADGPFKYYDTASSRAEITHLAQQVADERIAIVGLGGSGRYVLDFVAKAWVDEIHPFDPDVFLTHNAFRAPGAVDLETLSEVPLKVSHAATTYEQMRRGIVPHPYAIDATNVDELREFTFVFLAIDDAEAKKPIIDALIRFEIPFVDLGMGIELVDDHLTGVVRTTLVTPEHPERADRIPTVSAAGDDAYRTNIQIAELNAMNALQAVIAWKKYREIYADADGIAHTMYAIDTNSIVNDPVPPPDQLGLGDAA